MPGFDTSETQNAVHLDPSLWKGIPRTLLYVIEVAGQLQVEVLFDSEVRQLLGELGRDLSPGTSVFSGDFESQQVG